MEHILIKAKPEDISKHWGIIGQAVQNTAPGFFLTKKGDLNNLLQTLIEQKAQCWIAMVKEDDKIEYEPYGVMITQPVIDLCSGAQNLLIMCMTSFRTKGADPRMYVRGLDTLMKFARSIGCANIIGYTKIDKLCELAEKMLGGDASQRLVVVPVKEEDDGQ